MAMKISSPALENGAKIPRKYTGDGEDISPALQWTGVPAAAKELALICDDPDAPRPQPWVHWVIYKIPPTSSGLPEKVPRATQLKNPQGAVQGQNTWEKIGYGGPAPPKGHGLHHYHFRLYALDKPIAQPGGLDKQSLIAAMAGHILEEAELIGTYER